MAAVNSKLKGKYIIVVNAGSSTFKVQVISCDYETPILAVVFFNCGN